MNDIKMTNIPSMAVREVKTLRFPRHVPGRWSATFLTASVTTLTICIR